MGAAETIQAAIDKLLACVNTEADMVGAWRAEVHTDKAASIFDAHDVPVALDLAPVDAEAIVTLRRTIDAQLEALRAAQWLLGQKMFPLNYTHAATASIIRLAEAIVGEVTSDAS